MSEESLAGKQLWEVAAQKRRGPKFKFKQPSDIWDKAMEYFQWAIDNPLTEEKLFSYQGEIVRDEVSKMRALTKEGLFVFLQCSRDCWRQYSTGERGEEFVPVCKEIETIIYEQKFSGAAADLLNAAIISRDLGLADKQLHGGDSENPMIHEIRRTIVSPGNTNS